MTDQPEKTYCPHCHGHFTVNKDGTLRTHGYRIDSYGAGGQPCPGSGQKVVCPCVFHSKAAALRGSPDYIDVECLTHGLGSPY